jgi:hypothetical protein
MMEIKVCSLFAPVFSTDSDRENEEEVGMTCRTLTLVELPKGVGVSDIPNLKRFTVTAENQESLLESLHNSGLGWESSYEARFVNSMISCILNPGVIPLQVHTLENIEDLWAEADHFLSGALPRGYKEDPWDWQTDFRSYTQPLPFGKEVAVEPPIPQENTPSGNEGTPISDEDLRLGLAKALAEEKLDALYGDIDYLQEAIARDILEGRMDVGVDIKGLTREDLIKALTVLAGGADA